MGETDITEDAIDSETVINNSSAMTENRTMCGSPHLNVNKVTVMSTIAILTLISNSLIIIAIVKRQNKASIFLLDNGFLNGCG